MLFEKVGEGEGKNEKVKCGSDRERLIELHLLSLIRVSVDNLLAYETNFWELDKSLTF